MKKVRRWFYHLIDDLKQILGIFGLAGIAVLGFVFILDWLRWITE